MTPPDPDAPGAAAGRPLFLPAHPHTRAPAEGPGSIAHRATLRAGAAVLLVATAALHNGPGHWLADTRGFLLYMAVMAVCVAGAWPRVRPGRAERLRLLALDALALGSTVYITGAGRSWIFWIFLLLAVDRIPAGWRSTALAAGAGATAYLAVLGVAVGAQGQGLDAATEAGKVAALALAGTWATLVAWRVERGWRRQAADLADARALATDVGEDYGHLEESVAEERRDRSAFLFRLAGEVRAPLRELLRSTWAAERATGTGAGHGHLREIGVTARHILDIVNEVMDLARVETGTWTRELGPVSVRGALDDVLAQAGGAAERRRIRMPAHAPVGPEVRVVANDRKLRQVFANLISNAIKYNSAGGRIEVECETDDDWLAVRVRDTGPGIPAHRLDAAFEPFERLGAELRGIAGTGLGLPLARALVEAMGGELGVDTAPGVGSAFWFRLRLAAPRADERPATDPDDGTGPGQPALVLQIDASPENAGRVGQALAGRTDVELLWTPLGRQGLEAVASRRPALVLLHLRLLDMPVEEVFHRLRDTPGMEAVPIVAVAPDGQPPPELDRLLEIGARGPLTAPVRGPELLDLLNATLSER